MPPSALPTDGPLNELRDILRVSRAWALALLLSVGGLYGAAYWSWQSGQSLSAGVLAVLGYLFARSLRVIVFKQTWQHFRTSASHLTLLERVGEQRLLSSSSRLKTMLLEDPH